MRKTVSALLLSAFISLCVGISASAQDVAIKTNLLYDATATINAGFEVGLAPKWSLNVPFSFNGWSFPSKDYIYKHMCVQPEVRYWFCDRLAGHFLGIHVHGGAYNVGLIPNNIHFLGQDFSQLTDYRYQGYFVGGGLAYGYAWALAEHLNLEFELGVGYAYTQYEKFECEECGRKLAEGVPVHYFGPTKLAINFVYVF